MEEAEPLLGPKGRAGQAREREGKEKGKRREREVTPDAPAHAMSERAAGQRPAISSAAAISVGPPCYLVVMVVVVNRSLAAAHTKAPRRAQVRVGTDYCRWSCT